MRLSTAVHNSSLGAVLCALLSGCAHTQPQLFIDDLPSIEPPALSAFEPTAGDVPNARGVDPGETIDGGGVLMPTQRALELLQAEDVALPWYRDRLAIERRYRLADRDYAQKSYEALWTDAAALRREGDLMRLAVPVVAVLGVLVGCAIGLAADDIAEIAP